MTRTEFLDHLHQLQQALDHVQPLNPFGIYPSPEGTHSLVALQMTAAQICDDIYTILGKVSA